MVVEVSSDEVIAVMRERFPNQLTICVQAVQINKLQELVTNKEEQLEDDS